MIKFKENKELRMIYARLFLLLGSFIVMAVDVGEYLLDERLGGIFTGLICLAVLMTVGSVIVLLYETGIIKRKK